MKETFSKNCDSSYSVQKVASLN